MVMGPKGVPNTRMDWPTDCRSQNQLSSNQLEVSRELTT
jgi:hypothetical protein